jgi:hypothetical protein
MAISKNTSIDFAKIATEMRGIVSRWYNAEIKIIDPNVGDEVWDPATNAYTGNAAVEIYSGAARIQPVRNATTPDLGITQGSIQAIRVQVPYDDSIGLIRKGLQVRVTDGGENAVLEELEFVVNEAINSSYGWNTTIECEVSAKSVANG